MCCSHKQNDKIVDDVLDYQIKTLKHVEGEMSKQLPADWKNDILIEKINHEDVENKKGGEVI